MCGINGFNGEDRAKIEAMNGTTGHRGPDGTGAWVQDGVSLGHNRLAIIDLDTRASQPMLARDNTSVITFNGEIYNYKELKAELQDYPYKTESDTEVILAAYEKWGVECLSRLRGIFAFAIWDRIKKEWFVARDQLGVKQIYYYAKDGRFIFSSELRGILMHEVSRTVSLDALNQYFSLLYTPSPHTMVEGVQKLRAGSYLKVKGNEAIEHTYWQPLIAGKNIPDAGAVVQRVETAVRRQLVADRPIGILLSGGFDSSVVFHHAAKAGGIKEAFSIAFQLASGDAHEDGKFNADAIIAARTAHEYGIPHHVVRVDAEKSFDVFVRTLEAIDEPISNPTEISHYLISEQVRTHVPIVLSGDGGDEIFGGYDRYRYARLAEYFQNIPSPVRSLLSSVHPHFKKLNIPFGVEHYLSYMSQKDAVIDRVIEKTYRRTDAVPRHFKSFFENTLPFTEAFMHTDLKTWLVDEALMKADKISMAHGIEQRVPLLDVDLVEYALSIPADHRVSLFQGKKIFRDAYKNILPQYVLNQPKRGWFSPGAKWLRDPKFTELLKEILSPQYYSGTSTLFQWEQINKMYQDHQNRKGYYLHQLWALATFQVWARKERIRV